MTTDAQIYEYQQRQVTVNECHVAKVDRDRWKGIAQRAARLAESALHDDTATIDQLRQTLASIAYGR